MSGNSDVEKMTFEEALAELEEIVRDLEDGKVTLDQSINAYERGTALKNIVKKSCMKHNLKSRK